VGKRGGRAHVLGPADSIAQFLGIMIGARARGDDTEAGVEVKITNVTPKQVLSIGVRGSRQKSKLIHVFKYWVSHPSPSIAILHFS